MPLAPGTKAIGSNISELMHTGKYKQPQAVAIALSNARRHPRAMGGQNIQTMLPSMLPQPSVTQIANALPQTARTPDRTNPNPSVNVPPGITSQALPLRHSMAAPPPNRLDSVPPHKPPVPQYGQRSGQFNFTGGYSNFELLADAFERIGKSPAELTQTIMTSGRRSLNLLLQSIAGDGGPMMWAVPQEPLAIPLQQGVSTITLPPYVSSILDCYIRQYVNFTTVNINVAFTTNTGQTAVNIYQPAHGLLIGESINIVTPVSVGGLILQGYYLVSNVPDQNDFTITAASPATSPATNAGVVPQFTTTNTSANVSVALPNHGLSVGSGFNVPISTTVGGIILYGSYYVTSVTNTNAFIINAVQTATSGASVYLNGGQAQIQEQNANTVPTDRILTPMSRTDYNSLPYKEQQGFPYSYWAPRVQPPTMTFWQTPDGNGPYILNVYYLRQLQDANLGMGEIPDAQYRALEMITARLAVKLAVKFAPDKYEMLKTEANEEWGFFEGENREKVDMTIVPQLGGYFRG